MQFFECSISAPSSIESQSFMEFYRKRKKLQIHHISRVMQSHVVNMSYENVLGISRIYFSPLFFSHKEWKVQQSFPLFPLWLLCVAEGRREEGKEISQKKFCLNFWETFYTWLDFTTLINLIMC